jgi:hypothetical protein
MACIKTLQQSEVTIVGEGCTINVLLALALALASVTIDDIDTS